MSTRDSPFILIYKFTTAIHELTFARYFLDSRLNYDNVLKRLAVHSEESYYGLQNGPLAGNFEQDPPIFACRFSEAPGFEHILALANEDGRVAIQVSKAPSSVLPHDIPPGHS